MFLHKFDQMSFLELRFRASQIIITVNPLYTDTRYNDKISQFECNEIFAEKVTVNKKLCKKSVLKIQVTYVLDIC